MDSMLCKFRFFAPLWLSCACLLISNAVCMHLSLPLLFILVQFCLVFVYDNVSHPFCNWLTLYNINFVALFASSIFPVYQRAHQPFMHMLSSLSQSSSISCQPFTRPSIHMQHQSVSLKMILFSIRSSPFYCIHLHNFFLALCFSLVALSWQLIERSQERKGI